MWKTTNAENANIENINGCRALKSWTFTLLIPIIHTVIKIFGTVKSLYCHLEIPPVHKQRLLFYLHVWQLKSTLNAITNDLACSASPQLLCLKQATAVWRGCLPSAKSCSTKLAGDCGNQIPNFRVDSRWMKCLESEFLMAMTQDYTPLRGSDGKQVCSSKKLSNQRNHQALSCFLLF